MYRMSHERCLTSSGPTHVGCPAISVRGGRAMGRGRAKAKQTKVARELKYHSPNTDLAALQRELGARAGSDPDANFNGHADDPDDSDDEDEDDPDEDDPDEDDPGGR